MNQIFVSFDGGIEISRLELLAHSAVELGDVSDGCGNLHGAGRDQVDATVDRNDVLVISQRALALGLGFQHCAERLRPFKLSLGRGAARGIVFLRGCRQGGTKSQEHEQR